MYEKLINNTEELNAMAVHLRNSQNFSELKVLAAQWLVPKQDVEDFIKGKKFQLAEISLSEKEYTSAVEKLREEMWHMKDQLFTDIYGANRAGITSYLVKPIHPKEEIQIKVKRYLEAAVLYFYRKKRRREGQA